MGDDAEALKAAVDGLGEWLTENGVLNHLVRHLTYPQIEALAIAVISAWVNKRAEIAARPTSDDDPAPLAV